MKERKRLFRRNFKRCKPTCLGHTIAHCPVPMDNQETEALQRIMAMSNTGIERKKVNIEEKHWIQQQWPFVLQFLYTQQ